MDTMIAEMIVGLQLQDLNEQLSKSKGKGPETQQLSDEELALQIQQQEFERTIVELADVRMAHSIGRAVQDDGASVVILHGEERCAAADREMACRLSGQVAESIPFMLNLKADNDALSLYSALNANDDDGNNDNTAPTSVVAESSTLAASRHRKNPTYRRECVACNEETEVVQMPCSDHYCRRCTIRLFEGATNDETLFPPRCCRQNIPISLVHHFLGRDLAARIERKAIEYGTPNRTYCYSPACATFIEPGYVNGAFGTCPMPQCGRRTCVLCKKPAHDADCPVDDNAEEVLELSQREGWQRCSSCRNMIELRTGCNHIT